MRMTLLLFVFTLMLCGSAQAQTVDELLKSVSKALAAGKAAEALSLADKAITADPKNPSAYYLRGVSHDALGKHAEAVADFGKTIALEPKAADAYDRRGSAHFKQGKITESLADFDKYLEMQPKESPEHWRRGITLYYAGKFDEGRKQFESHQTVNTNDVENAVWHFLCNAKVVGVEKARAQIIKIGPDKRIPLMEVLALFKNEAKLEDVMKAAHAGEPTAAALRVRLFYAHLYLGLYYEALGEKKLALEHMTKAAVDFRTPGYMGDVARVHMELRKKETK